MSRHCPQQPAASTHRHQIRCLFFLGVIVLTASTPYAAAEQSHLRCKPVTPPECGVRINRDLPTESIPSPKLFRWQNTSRKTLNLSERLTSGFTKEVQEKKTERFGFSYHYDVALMFQDGRQGFLKVRELTDAKPHVPDDSTLTSFEHPPIGSVVQCNVSEEGRYLDGPCVGELLSPFLLPKEPIAPGQTQAATRVVKMNLGGIQTTLHLERESVLVDYVRFNDSVLARLKTTESLTEVEVPADLESCPKVYYTGTTLLYYELGSQLPYNVMQLTKVGIRKNDFRKDLNFVVSIKRESE